MAGRRFRYTWYRQVYDSAANDAAIADAVLSVVADKPSSALYYQGACEVWLALADLMRSLDALGVRPSAVRREIEDMASTIGAYLGCVTDDCVTDDKEEQ